MPGPNLSELRRGDQLNGIYLVETANFKQARNGKPFLQLVLRDSSASVRGVRWETSQEEFRALERCPFLSIQGRVEEFQGQVQVVVDQLEPVSAADARIDPRDFLPRSRFDIEQMSESLTQIVRSIPNAPVRALVEKILARPAVARGLPLAPAGKALHHAYVGGLLEHVLSLSRLAIRVIEHYPWLDRSVLLAGVILHDIGKVEELSYDVGFGYTDAGQLLGHIVIALGWIEESASSISTLDAGTLTHIKHLVASHHGRLDFGSPKVPMTAEAVALHFLDNLDAKLAALDQLERDLPAVETDRWSEFNPMLGSRAFFPQRLKGNGSDRPQAPPPQGELSFDR